MPIEIKIKILDNALPIPKYYYQGDAGCDLCSRVDLILKPGERALVPTGIELSIPKGYAGFIQPRSGLSYNNGISIVNTPGLIDSSYRGEICAILINLDKKHSFSIKHGDKICQIVFKKIEKARFVQVYNINKTRRGKSGFGSSDKNKSQV